MAALPTLRRELLSAFALVFAGALLFFVVGYSRILASLNDPRQQSIAMVMLVAADIGIFTFFGRYLLRRRVIGPLERIVDEIESIARGDSDRRLPSAETQELARLATAVNHMAERLITDQAELAANIRSLDETNRLLTEARDAMVRAEKMASVGRLSAGIAHEVGNPLGAILGYIGLVSRNADEQRMELLKAAQREAHRIDRIVRGLLDYARPRDPKTQAIDVNQVVRDTVELLNTQGRLTQVEVEVDLAPRLPAVFGDPFQLQQVLVNLMVNSMDALAGLPEPRIIVQTRTGAYQPSSLLPSRRRDDPPGVDYTHRRRLARVSNSSLDANPPESGRVVEIRITDNGPGIPADLLDQVFEPFVTSKEPGQGTGLGLAVSARLVETMGGAVRAESAAGEGAAFTVTLPVSVMRGMETES
ncbi:MAG: sensor histidine kinase [Longimicrobiales bacterium]